MDTPAFREFLVRMPRADLPAMSTRLAGALSADDEVAVGVNGADEVWLNLRTMRPSELSRSLTELGVDFRRRLNRASLSDLPGDVAAGVAPLLDAGPALAGVELRGSGDELLLQGGDAPGLPASGDATQPVPAKCPDEFPIGTGTGVGQKTEPVLFSNTPSAATRAEALRLARADAVSNALARLRQADVALPKCPGGCTPSRVIRLGDAATSAVNAPGPSIGLTGGVSGGKGLVTGSATGIFSVTAIAEVPWDASVACLREGDAGDGSPSTSNPAMSGGTCPSFTSGPMKSMVMFDDDSTEPIFASLRRCIDQAFDKARDDATKALLALRDCPSTKCSAAITSLRFELVETCRSRPRVPSFFDFLFPTRVNRVCATVAWQVDRKCS